MELSLIWLQWITAIIFTICAFIWKREFYFTMFAGLFWLTTAYSMVQIHYLGFGSTNVIIYDHEMGDWYGDIGLFWLVWSNFLMMMILTLYRILKSFSKGGKAAISKREDLIKHIVGE